MEKVDYLNGGAGFARWVEDFVYIPTYPKGVPRAVWTPMKDLSKEPHPATGRSYYDMWQSQKEIMHEALQMQNGLFRYNLIVLCWPRGEGKTFLNCLVVLWRFFCMPLQRIVLCSNSKDQTDFIAFDTIKSVVQNSPVLRASIGVKNIQNREMRFRDNRNNIKSTIRSISSFSGVMSGITAYSFTEIFEMKNPEFYNQIHGSIRNVPNSMGIIDSTVSSKDHTLFRLYSAYIAKTNEVLFFSHRSSPAAMSEDYWHPNNTQAQLDGFRDTMLPSVFDRSYKNVWEIKSDKVFSADIVSAMNYMGVEKMFGAHNRVIELVKRKREILDNHDPRYKKFPHTIFKEINQALWDVESIYNLKSGHAGIHALNELGDLLSTNWGIIVGLDRAAPMKTNTSARTVVICMAKGMVGSKFSRKLLNSQELPQYVYFIVGFNVIEDNSMDGIKSAIMSYHSEFDGVDVVSSEPWGVWDMKAWCESNGMVLELLHPSQSRQMAMFTELYTILSNGLLKCPSVPCHGAMSDDILQEELKFFDHIRSGDKLVFGSPEKTMLRGRQDDSVFALACGVYGGKTATIDCFKERSGSRFYGMYIPEKDLVGAY